MGPTISGILPGTPMPVGTALGYKTMNANGENVFGLANGAQAYGTSILYAGLQTRDSRSFPGLNATEIAFGLGVETPFLAGADGSVEPDLEIDVEGSAYVLAYGITPTYPDGTSAATDANNTAIALRSSDAAQTELTFRNGLFSKALSTDFVTHILLTANKTPQVAGNLRIVAQRVGTYKKP